MATSATILSLPQMVDIALNTPEVGVVNFTVLHSLLHVIVAKLKLSSVNVEFRGADSERLQTYLAATTKPGQCTLTLTEYTIQGKGSADSSAKGSKDSKEKGQTDEAQKEKKSVVDMGEKEKQKKEKPPKQKKVQKTSESEGGGSIVLIQSSSIDSNNPQYSVAVTKEDWEAMEKNVTELKEKVRELESLPKNDKIIEALSSEEKTPVLDMYQILQLSKRVDAAEVAMAKIASMIEELVKGSIGSAKGSAEAVNATDEIKDKLEDLKLHVDEPGRRPSMFDRLERRVTDLETKLKDSQTKALADQFTLTDDNGAWGWIYSSNPDVSEMSAEPFHGTSKERLSMAPNASTVGGEPEGLDVLKQVIVEIQEQIAHINISIADIRHAQPQTDTDEAQLPPEQRLKQLELKIQENIDQINSVDSGFNRLVTALTNRVSDAERDIGELMEKLNLSSDQAEQQGVIPEMQDQIVFISDSIKEINDTITKVIEDFEQKQHTIDVLKEQIELLKTVKADREDLEDALADKADACAINRKVSFDQFDQVYNDMSKSLEETLAKLSQQEVLWTQALDEIQKSIGSKMDRGELNPLREFINSKLKVLQEKFKALSQMKKENEAAGTKSKYLRNVNCISCDKDVVMRKEIDSSLYPKPATLPPARSMGPYLAYELDQLRKQQKCLPNTKNLNMLENALQAGKIIKGPDHLCNRYCGGSHTLTTPQQRVTRMGHFLEQWGPEIAPVNDTMVRGTDGRMYRGRDDEQLKKLATEKPPAIKDNLPPPPIQIVGNDATRLTQAEVKPSIKDKDGILEIFEADRKSHLV